MGGDERVLESSALSLDACLELLSNHQRRALLGHFVDSEEPYAPIDELITVISDEAATKRGERPGHDSVAATLFHVHLPKLAAAGVVDYDTRHLEVRYEGDPALERLYETVREFE